MRYDRRFVAIIPHHRGSCTDAFGAQKSRRMRHAHPTASFRALHPRGPRLICLGGLSWCLLVPVAERGAALVAAVPFSALCRPAVRTGHHLLPAGGKCCAEVLFRFSGVHGNPPFLRVDFSHQREYTTGRGGRGRTHGIPLASSGSPSCVSLPLVCEKQALAFSPENCNNAVLSMV